MMPGHAPHEHAPIDCHAALEQLFDFLDGEIDDALEVRLRAHVAGCKHCFATADFERRFLEMVHQVRDEETCPRAVRERILATLRTEGLGA